MEYGEISHKGKTAIGWHTLAMDEDVELVARLVGAEFFKGDGFGGHCGVEGGGGSGTLVEQGV